LRAIVNEAGKELSKMVRENGTDKHFVPARFAAIIVGVSGVFRERLARVLRTGGFQLVGLASTMDELAAFSVGHDLPLLIVIDSGDQAGATISQIEVAKRFHPEARIAAVLGEIQIAASVPLFQAGAHVCFDRRADPENRAALLRCWRPIKFSRNRRRLGPSLWSSGRRPIKSLRGIGLAECLRR